MPKATTACPDCGTGLVNIVSGAVCPKGCPGVHPAVEPEVSRANVRAYKISLLPEAVRLPKLRARKDSYADCHLYAIKGRSLVYRRVRRASTSLDKCPEHHVLVRMGGDPYELALAPAPLPDGRNLCLPIPDDPPEEKKADG